jgi:hypothetical protein
MDAATAESMDPPAWARAGRIPNIATETIMVTTRKRRSMALI